MGDTISRSDIQHAVDSAIHDVRNEVSRISHSVNSLNKAGQDIHDLSRRLQGLEQAVSQIQNTVANTLGRPASRRYPDPYIVAIANDVTELKMRFANIERFLTQAYDYIRRRNDEDKEDKQYRSM